MNVLCIVRITKPRLDPIVWTIMKVIYYYVSWSWNNTIFFQHFPDLTGTPQFQFQAYIVQSIVVPGDVSCTGMLQGQWFPAAYCSWPAIVKSPSLRFHGQICAAKMLQEMLVTTAGNRVWALSRFVLFVGWNILLWVFYKLRGESKTSRYFNVMILLPGYYYTSSMYGWYWAI